AVWVIYLTLVTSRNHGKKGNYAMAKVKIAIIIGTTRAARFGDKPAKWIEQIAAQRGDLTTEVLDLRDYPMPFFDEVASNAWAPPPNSLPHPSQTTIPPSTAYI